MEIKQEYSKTKKEIIFFILFTFSITFITNGIAYFLNHKFMATFIAFQMLYPALGTMVTGIIFNKDNISKKSLNFFKFYIVSSIVLLIILLLSVAFIPDIVEIANTIGAVIMSIVLLIVSLRRPTDMLETVDLRKNIKDIFILSGFFILTKLMPLIPAFVTGQAKPGGMILTAVLSPILIAISSINFFGEEYGWRTYLQDKLIFLLGKKKGVILLGLIWALWHTPICFMFYTPNQPILGLLQQIVFCIFLGIFLSYSIMKSKSLWPCIAIHWLNNNMVAAMTGGSFTREVDVNAVIILTIMVAVLYGPFIFTKEFKEDKRIIQIDNTKTIE